jgi:flagellar biosynthesis protein FlhG
MMTSEIPVVTSVSSGKGGVGKTFATINLAACLSRMGRKVLIVDCDLGLANIDIMLGVNPQYTLKDVIFGSLEFPDVVISTKYGFDFVPASSGIKEMAQLLYENIDRINAAIGNIALSYDHVLLDTGAGISENVLQFTLFAKRNIVVLNRELTSLTDAYATIKVIYQTFGRHNFEIIVNSTRGDDEGKNIFAHIDTISGKFLGFHLNYLGQIPYDEAVSRSILKQEVLSFMNPQSLAAINCSLIAGKMADWR